MHDSSVQQFVKFKEKYLRPGVATKIADVGCYDEGLTYKNLLSDPAWSYSGIDMRPGLNVTFVPQKQYEWDEIPADGFDVVISGQTLEHVEKPWLWIRAVQRILAPGGLAWICAPNTWGFHEFPKDCWRIWPDGMRALFDEAGLIEVEVYAEGQDTVGIGRKR